MSEHVVHGGKRRLARSTLAPRSALYLDDLLARELFSAAGRKLELHRRLDLVFTGYLRVMHKHGTRYRKRRRGCVLETLDDRGLPAAITPHNDGQWSAELDDSFIVGIKASDATNAEDVEVGHGVNNLARDTAFKMRSAVHCTALWQALQSRRSASHGDHQQDIMGTNKVVPKWQ